MPIDSRTPFFNFVFFMGLFFFPPRKIPYFVPCIIKKKYNKKKWLLESIDSCITYQMACLYVETPELKKI